MRRATAVVGVAGVVLAVVVAGAWRLGLTAAPADAAAQPGAAKTQTDDGAARGDVWRLSETTTLYLIASEQENEPGVVRLVSGAHTVEYETGTTLWFGDVCVLGSYPNQLVIVPYIWGQGTGVAWYSWVLIRLGDDPVFQQMGVWECVAVSLLSAAKFELSPALTGSTESGEPRLRFTFTSTQDDGTRVISGMVVVEFRQGERRPFQLVPAQWHDALACLDMVEAKALGGELFGRDALRAMHLDELDEYLNADSAKQAAEEKLRDAIERRYAADAAKHSD